MNQLKIKWLILIFFYGPLIAAYLIGFGYVVETLYYRGNNIQVWFAVFFLFVSVGNTGLAIEEGIVNLFKRRLMPPNDT